MGILELVEPAWWTVERAGLGVGSLTAAIALYTMNLNRISLRESHRPMMLARLDYGEDRATSPLDLIVSNVGQSPAHKVKVTFDPEFPTSYTSKNGKPSVISLIRKRYSQTFPVWPPGVERRNVFWIIDGGPNEDFEVESVAGLPREIVAVVRYKRRPNRMSRHITERFPLRISEFENETFTETKTHRSTRRVG